MDTLRGQTSHIDIKVCICTTSTGETNSGEDTENPWRDFQERLHKHQSAVARRLLFLSHSSFLFLFLLRGYGRGKNSTGTAKPLLQVGLAQDRSEKAQEGKTYLTRSHQWPSYPSMSPAVGGTTSGDHANLATFCSIVPEDCSASMAIGLGMLYSTFLSIPFSICLWTFSPLFFPFPFWANWYCYPPQPSAAASSSSPFTV